MPSIIRSPKRGRQVVHAMDVRGTFVAVTCCGIKGGGWGITSRKVTCKACIRKMAVSVANGENYYREELREALDIQSHTETIERLVELLKITHRMVIECPLAVRMSKKYYMEKYSFDDWSNKELHKLIEKEIARFRLLKDVPYGTGKQFLQLTPPLAGLVSALTDMKDTDVSKLQRVKIETIAQTKGITVAKGFKELSKSEADELIEWLEEVVMDGL